MWRSLRLAVSKTEISPSRFQRRHSSSTSTSNGGAGKLIVGVIAVAGTSFAGAVVYGKYDPKFKKILLENVPYIDSVYKLFPDEDKKSPVAPKKSGSEEGLKDAAMSGGLLRKKLDREKSSAAESQKKPAIEPSTKESAFNQGSDPKISESNLKIESKPSEQNVSLLEKQALEHASNEKIVSELIKKLEKSTEETMAFSESAVKAVKHHTQTLYDALDLPEGKDGDMLWKEVNKTSSEKNSALKLAEDKASQTKDVLERLKVNMKKVDSKSQLVKSAEESAQIAAQQLHKAEAEVTSAKTEATTAGEYQKLVNASKEQFRKELEIVLPNYIYGDKDKAASENDLNLLIAHAHRRIEQLQKQLAKQQVTEKQRVDEAMNLQKMRDDNLTESKIKAELERRHIDLESAVSERVAFLKDNFESELRQQLRRQAAAHADHIQEVLKVQEQELERKYSLDLEEKLLHQKGVFISEVSGNMARLRGILAYLKAKSEFDTASKKAQALWLACQAMSYKIAADNGGAPLPLGKDVAAVKIAADEDSEFISTVLAAIPAEAVTRGVYNGEVLKQRFFQDVKNVCRRVALIDENNDSLYRYMLSYLQSFLVVDVISIPKEELEGKVAVDPSQWDTFDILSRVSYCLQNNDLEQALRYANQFRGEPRLVARDWINEVRLLLETQLAVKALLTHAAAVGVQAYH